MDIVIFESLAVCRGLRFDVAADVVSVCECECISTAGDGSHLQFVIIGISRGVAVRIGHSREAPRRIVFVIDGTSG